MTLTQLLWPLKIVIVKFNLILLVDLNIRLHPFLCSPFMVVVPFTFLLISKIIIVYIRVLILSKNMSWNMCHTIIINDTTLTWILNMVNPKDQWKLQKLSIFSTSIIVISYLSRYKAKFVYLNTAWVCKWQLEW